MLKQKNNAREKTFPLFIDYWKSFDTVNRSILLNKLRKLGVDPNLIQTIRTLFE